MHSPNGGSLGYHAKGLCLVSLLFLGVSTLPTPAWAQMNIVGYDPARHDRFYEGADRDFLGEAVDLSGVGRRAGSAGRWGTLIAPNVYVAADHFAPVVGDTLRFYADNSADGVFEERTVISIQRIFEGDVTTDLQIGFLNTPVSDAIATYPIAVLPNNFSYRQAQIYVLGRSNTSDSLTNIRLGRAIIKSFGSTSIGTLVDGMTVVTNTSQTYTFDQDEAAAEFGPDAALPVLFDSGGPAFLVIDGQLALVGLHMAVDDILNQGFDTAVFRYLDDIQTITSNAAQTVGHSTVQSATVELLPNGNRLISWPNTMTDVFGVFSADSAYPPDSGPDSWTQISPDIQYAPGGRVYFEDTRPPQAQGFYQVRADPFGASTF
ncbi:MAG: hypothetical protein ACFBZ8_09505 [Opitutales bacterium]